jgi:hypothetical protein
VSVRELVGPVRVWKCDTCGREVTQGPEETFYAPSGWIWVELRAGVHGGPEGQHAYWNYCSLACAQVGAVRLLRDLQP